MDEETPNEEAPDIDIDRFSLDEGDVVFSRPSQLSQESYNDLADWFDIIMRRLRRNCGITK